MPGCNSFYFIDKVTTAVNDTDPVTIRLEGDHGVKIIEARPSSTMSVHLPSRNIPGTPTNLRYEYIDLIGVIKRLIQSK